MAVANPTRDTTETAAEITRLIKELPVEDQERLVLALEEAIETARRTDNHRVVVDVVQAWLGLVLARRDPNYRANMARGDSPRGDTFSLEEIKQRFPAPPPS
jgi:hypothetical protein